MVVLEGSGEWLSESMAAKALLVCAVVGLTVHLLIRKKYNMPPGPRGWPILGNILNFRGTTTYRKLIEWKAIYGPVITFSVGPMTTVALNNKDVVLEALVKNQADFAGRPQLYSTHMMTDGGKDITFGDYSPTWKLHRKIATKAVRHYMTGTKLEKGIEDTLVNGVELLKQQKGAFHPHLSIDNIVFNIINSICFSKTCDVNDEYFKFMIHTFDVTNEVLGNGFLEDFFPPLRVFLTPKARRANTTMKGGLTAINEEIEKHRKSLNKDNVRDFCDTILLAQQEAIREEDPELLSQLTDSHVTQTINDIFGAGLDTLRFTLIWSLFYLSVSQDIQKKMQDEIDQTFGDRKYPKLSDRPQLQYTDAVLHEVMRMSSIVPLGVPHKTIKDTSVGGYDIPKGTTVLINYYALHYDPNEWRNPEIFDPERYLNANGKMAPKPDSWLPFSAGRRVCLGESVAKPALHLLLAGIMRHFKVSFPPGAKVDFETEGGSFVNLPKPYKVIMEPRI